MTTDRTDLGPKLRKFAGHLLNEIARYRTDDRAALCTDAASCLLARASSPADSMVYRSAKRAGFTEHEAVAAVSLAAAHEPRWVDPGVASADMLANIAEFERLRSKVTGSDDGEPDLPDSVIEALDLLAKTARQARDEVADATRKMAAVTPPAGPSSESQVIVFSDKTGQPRTAEDVERMIEDIQAVAERYGFKWSQRGTLSAMRRQFAEWQARLDRDDLAEMLAEYRERRDAKDGGHGE